MVHDPQATPDADTIAGAAHETAMRLCDPARHLLVELIKMQSHTPAGIAQIQKTLHPILSGLEFDVEKFTPADSTGQEIPTLIGWLGKRSLKPDILLCTHVDTSPTGCSWTKRPYRGETYDGVIYGRGAMVSKSDVASYIHGALAAFEATKGHVASPSIAVAITGDEGNGGELGAARIIDELGLRPGVVICPGATDLIATGHKGCIQMRVEVTGASCHQSVLPVECDAMRRVAELCTSIYALDDRNRAKTGRSADGEPSLNVSLVEGGVAFGMAPAKVRIWIDRRVNSDEDLAAAHQEIIDILDGPSRLKGTTVRYETERIAEPMRPTQSQHRFVHIIREEAKSAFDLDVTTGTASIYCDARWFSKAGCPTLLFGAGDSDLRQTGANGADENVPVEIFNRAVCVLARAIARIVLKDNVE